MVWCNQLVVALAKLLISLTQPSIVTHHWHAEAQQRIGHELRATTQPHIAPMLEWASPAVADAGAHAHSRNPLGRECKLRAVKAGAPMSEGQMLDVINVSSTGGCSHK